LQNAGRIGAIQHAELKKLLYAKAAANGWPLTLRSKKGRLAYLRAIDAKGFPVYVTTTDNIISAATIRTNQLWPGGSTNLGLSGSSANMKSKLAVWDEGLVRPTHVELVGRVTQVDHSPTLSDHSTHVSGTLIAAGVNPSAKGMSFGAQQLLCYDFDGDENEMMTAAGNGLLVSSHSYADIAGWFFDDTENRWEFWGNPGDTVDIRFGLYDQDTQIWDSIAYNAPNYLIAKASGNNPGEQGPGVGQTYWRMNANGTFVNSGARPAGISNNAGYNTIATYGDAKNILTIGAVNPIPGGYNKPSDVVLASFSSLGPSGDGRIKPDLVADGVNVLSSISTADNAYDIYSGTSMATPASAGSSFLLQEYYSKLHGGAFMRAATLKGLLIHTADEAGLAPGPDYAYGWGLIDMQRAASVITSDNTDHTQLIKESSLTNGSKNTETFPVVASGKTALIATISWTDPPHAATVVPSGSHNFQDTDPKLVNDLDLRITDNVTGKVYMPWVLNPLSPSAAATKRDNILDNVERVEAADSLIPGRAYTITVSHKGTIARNGTQAYSLLVSGIGGTSTCASASTSQTGTVIDKVTTSNLNYSDPAPCHKGYIDETAQTPIKFAVGQTIPFSISYHSCDAATPTNIAIYIDFNNNGTFEASELVAQNGTSLSSGAGSTAFTGSLTIPTTAATGNYTLMRVIAQDGALTTPAGCGSYTAGQTQDYRVVFTNPANDVGVTSLEYPTQTTCASDSQIVSIRIHNFGTTVQTFVPVTTTVTSGATTVKVFTATCMDSIPAGGEVVFTYNTTFQTTNTGSPYTFTSTTSLSGDGNPANNGNTTTVAINAAPAAISGTATICGSNATQVVLKATTNGVDLPFWYDSPTASTPIAAGNNTTSTDITANRTYYVGVNDLRSKAGAPNKLVYSPASGNQGSYFRFGGNFVKFTTSVPLTIESAKLYVGHSGQLSLTLATLASIDQTTGQYSYFPLYNTTIDLYATKQVPSSAAQIPVPVGDNSDTGAIFYLNIPIPTPGDYILIMDCSDSTNLFLNTGIPTNHYPVSLPGVFAVTGNDQYDLGKADSATYYQKFYYAFYNIGIRLTGCPSATRTTVTATTEASPSITQAGNVLTSTATTGNQWYLGDSLLVGHTGITDTVNFPGAYHTSVTDPTTGCILSSNSISYSPGGSDNASIGLLTSPNPNPGTFLLQFYFTTQDNTSITLTNTLGQRVYEADYPNFTGTFSQQINTAGLASGMYILKIIHGGKTYHKQLIVRR
jgi:hypothetical protein